MPKLHLELGRPYYHLKWVDPAFTIPGLQPFFFIGTNLSVDDDTLGTTYYFQDSISFTWCGSLAEPDKMKPHDDIVPYTMTCREPELDVAWFTLDGAIAELVGARDRAAGASEY